MNEFHIAFIYVLILLFAILRIIWTESEKDPSLTVTQDQKEYKDLIGYQLGTCLITNIEYTQNKTFIICKNNRRLELIDEKIKN